MPHSRYTGPSGRTRVERVRVFRTHGGPCDVEVFRVLNVEEHPELRTPALGGTLHQLDDGERIDVPFVYHDPINRLFALVIPHAARSRELSERARLLEALIEERDAQVPAYVRDFVVVRGHHGLQRLFDESQVLEVDVAELEPVALDPQPGVPIDLTRFPVPSNYYPRVAALLPTADFYGRDVTELATLVDDEELWLFARLASDEEDAFGDASSDLLIQLKVVHQVPLVVLTLIDTPTGRRRRAYLNPARSADGRILDLLRRDFHATVVIQTSDGELLRSYRVEAPRAANTQMILERTQHAPKPTRERWEAILDQCREAPLLATGVDHPFSVEPPARDAQEALQRLRRLEAWSTPARAHEAISHVGVPLPMFELARRRAVADGVRFGLAMSSGLLLQAVRFGLGADVHSLLRELERRFDEIVADPSGHSLTEEEVRRNRLALERLSARHATSTEPILSCNMQAPG